MKGLCRHTVYKMVFPLAPIEVEILFVFSLKTKRLERKAGIWFYSQPKRFAPKKLYALFLFIVDDGKQDIGEYQKWNSEELEKHEQENGNGKEEHLEFVFGEGKLLYFQGKQRNFGVQDIGTEKGDDEEYPLIGQYFDHD